MLLDPDELEAYQAQFVQAVQEEQRREIGRLARLLSSARMAVLLAEAPEERIHLALMTIPIERAGRILGYMQPVFVTELLGDGIV